MRRNHGVLAGFSALLISVFGIGAGAAKLPAPRCSLAGSPWQVVDSPEGGDIGRARSAAAWKEAIYVVGALAGDDGIDRWAVRRSLDRGESWQTVDRFSLSEEEGLTAVDVAVDPRNGHVYVIGAGKHSWLVRKSTDRGETWRTVDDFAMPDHVAVPARVAVDGRGVVYVAGGADSPHDAADRRAILRRSTDGGSSWATQDFASSMARFTALAASLSGAVLIGGESKSPLAGVEGTPWTVLHSRNGVEDWDFVEELADGPRISHGAVDEDGRVFMVGSYVTPSGRGRWTVRASRTANPSEWSEFRGYEAVGSDSEDDGEIPESIAYSRNGTLYVGTGTLVITREGDLLRADTEWTVRKRMCQPSVD